MPGMKDAPALYRALKFVLPKVLVPWLPITIEGVEDIPDEPVIFAANHMSFVDSIVIPVSVQRPIYYLAKADYFESWRTRWFFRGAGTVPTQRSAAGLGALQTGVEILRSGDSIGIYPEGTRSPDGRLYRGKTGPVRMALEAGAPIVPVGLEGTVEVQPPGTYGLRRHPVSVRFGQPLDLSRYADQRRDPFALRAATDELMFEIMMLSGQEYVDEYAAKVKKGEVDVDTLTLADGPTAEDDGPRVVGDDEDSLRDAGRAAG